MRHSSSRSKVECPSHGFKRGLSIHFLTATAGKREGVATAHDERLRPAQAR